MANRTDTYNLAADIALETAIGTLMNLEQTRVLRSIAPWDAKKP